MRTQKYLTGSSDKSHLTAISRRKPSAPARRLHETGRLVGKCLDFGCGRGFDADFYNMRGYDPFWRPIYPTGEYDTIVCIYVLNVIPDPQKRARVIEEMLDLLSTDGKIYITVRRGIKEGFTSRGTYQASLLFPEYPTVHKTHNYRTYVIGEMNEQFGGRGFPRR